MSKLRQPLKFSFLLKAGAALGLIAAADVLLFHAAPGAVLGGFAASWAVVVLLLRPDLRRDWRALACLAAGLGFAAALADRPDAIRSLLFCLSLFSAALLPRTGRFRDAVWWVYRLVLQGLAGLIAPLQDALRVLGRTGRRRGKGPGLGQVLLTLAVPTLGAIVFMSLFSAANPVLARLIGEIDPGAVNPARVLFWGLVLIAAWATLRPRVLQIRPAIRRSALAPAQLPAASVILSLVVFNAIFAIENGLDIAFLWSGAPLPADGTLADYAHRGAYTLIATALLAGLFVLLALRPGTGTAERPVVRWLVAAWVAQNLLLVASSALRTINYVEAYSLTGLRIAALAWMALVAVGLVLICWRLLRDRSASWLINANALTALVVLSASCFVDLGQVSADWNVRHARDVGGQGAALDLDYLDGLGGSALNALVELEGHPLPAALHARVSFLRRKAELDLRRQQGDWRRWTWRGARQLAAAQAGLAALPATALTSTPRT